MTKRKQPKTFGYRNYSFVDKDPIIDAMRAILTDNNLSYRENAKQIRAATGITTGTLRGWFRGPTRRPNFATAAAFCRFYGYDIVDMLKRSRGEQLGRPTLPFGTNVHQLPRRSRRR